MMTAIVQFIKECKKSILALIVIVAVVFIGCYVYTLQAENNSYKNHLQSAKDENRQLLDEKIQLVNSFKDQLQSIKDTNQQLLNEKKKKQKENDQINAELQSIKDNNQRLLKENEESQKKIDQIKVELQSVKDDNQKVLEEKRNLQKQNHQLIADLQSTEESNKEARKEQIRWLENRDVYTTQVAYIQKWMEPIEKLEEHIQAVVYCSESKKKGSKYSKPKMCAKIDYDFHESYTNEIVITTIDLIIRFKQESRKFLDALLLKKVEEMKTLQADTDMSKIKEKMEEFNEEISGFKIPKKKDETLTVTPSHYSQETAVEKPGILYRFGKWVVGMIVGLFW